MTIPKETLMAYVDGELPPAERRAVEAELAADPELKSYVERHQLLSRTLHDSFDEVLRAPVPQALTDALAPPMTGFAIPWRRLLLWSGAPAAAALACGVVIGILFLNRAEIVSSGGVLVAHGGLADALTRQLTSEQTAQADIGISFRNKDGHYCRTFRAQALAGVACREVGEWRIAAVGKVASEPSGAYQPAASGMPDFVRDAVTGMISGEPLDAAGERKARASGWAAH
jgi:Putative zinc-finger